MKYRKKPVVIEATQWFKDGDHPNVTQNLDGHFGIETLEGFMRANTGDWIIKGVKGEHYPCKPDIFALTYESEAGTKAVLQQLLNLLGPTAPECSGCAEEWQAAIDLIKGKLE